MSGEHIFLKPGEEYTYEMDLRSYFTMEKEKHCVECYIDLVNLAKKMTIKSNFAHTEFDLSEEVNTLIFSQQLSPMFLKNVTFVSF